MGDSIEEKVRAYSQVARLLAYDLNASFGDEQLGRIEKRVVDKHGKRHLDAQVWEAGDVAYQCLKQRYPKGITSIEYVQTANEFLSLACDVFYPGILELAEAGKIDIEPNGAQGLKDAWAEYGWCERLIFIFDFFEETIGTGAYNAIAVEKTGHATRIASPGQSACDQDTVIARQHTIQVGLVSIDQLLFHDHTPSRMMHHGITCLVPARPA